MSVQNSDKNGTTNCMYRFLLRIMILLFKIIFKICISIRYIQFVKPQPNGKFDSLVIINSSTERFIQTNLRENESEIIAVEFLALYI